MDIMNKMPNVRYEYASLVNKFFNESSDEEVSKVLMENSACSFRTALEYYRTKNSINSNYKYAIMMMGHSYETVLKARLALFGKGEILSRNSAKGRIETLNVFKCVEQLNRHGIIVSENHKKAVKDLREVRNVIEHFGFLGNKVILDQLISFCASVYWAFMIEYMDNYGIRKMLTDDQFETLMTFEEEHHFAKCKAAEIMYQWSLNLHLEQDQYLLRHCKECLTLSIILDLSSSKGRCRCCGTEYKLNEYADDIVDNLE